MALISGTFPPSPRPPVTSPCALSLAQAGAPRKRVSRPLLVARPSGDPEPAHALQRDSVREMSSSRQRIPSFEGYSEPPL